MQEIRSFIDLMKALHDKNSCREFLENYRWQGVPVCPHCKHKSEHHYKLKNKGEFNGLYKCQHCKKRFTVTVGTMFEGSKIPLEKWFYAIYIFLSHKKGISSLQLSRDINVTQKTAWFMLTKIRHNMYKDEIEKFRGIVQMDETYVGGKNKNKWNKGTQGRSLKEKTPVVGVLTEDRVYPVVTYDTSQKTLHLLVFGLIEEGSTLVTDGWAGYNGLSHLYTRVIIEHSKGIYAKDGFHTNGIEGFWSHLKRGIKGIYHVVSPKYLQMYCNEFAYRYNTRTLTDMQRFMEFMPKINKRLKHAKLKDNIYN